MVVVCIVGPLSFIEYIRVHNDMGNLQIWVIFKYKCHLYLYLYSFISGILVLIGNATYGLSFVTKVSNNDKSFAELRTAHILFSM
jgi:hypothetical protein